jgi:hypothetical protein
VDVKRSSPTKHYTQLDSQLLAAVVQGPEGFVLTVRMGGFVSTTVAERVVAEVDARDASPGVLVDLRDVAGYDADAVRVANVWLRSARRRDVRKIAFVTSSSVLRTAITIAGRGTGVVLSTFDDEATARLWLCDVPPVAVETKHSEPLPAPA